MRQVLKDKQEFAKQRRGWGRNAKKRKEHKCEGAEEKGPLKAKALRVKP